MVNKLNSHESPSFQAFSFFQEQSLVQETLKAVNSCTKKPLTKEQVGAMLKAAKEKGSVAVPTKIEAKEQGLARSLILTPEGKCKILMTHCKKGGDKIVSNAGNFKQIKNCVTIDLNHPGTLPTIDVVGVCKKKRCEEKGNLWETAQKDFSQEAALLETFHGNDAVLQTHFFLSSPEKSYLGMEKCDGDLYDEIDAWQKKPISYTDQLHIARDCARGLQALHEKNLVYRDLKPDNYLMKNGRVKIADLGLACQAGSKDTEDFVGTAMWFAPERAKAAFSHHLPKDMAAATKQSSDIFPLGELFYEIFNETQSNFPFQLIEDPLDTLDEIDRLQQFEIDLLVENNGSIPPAMQNLILQMLKRSPADRTITAKEAADLLDKEIQAL